MKVFPAETLLNLGIYVRNMHNKNRSTVSHLLLYILLSQIIYVYRRSALLLPQYSVCALDVITNIITCYLFILYLPDMLVLWLHCQQCFLIEKKHL